jgi:membrane protein
MRRVLEWRWVKLVVNAGQGFLDDNCGQMAAALAYFSLLSAFPLLLLVSQIPNLLASFSVDYDVAATLIDLARTRVSPTVADWLQSSLTTLEEGQGTAGVVGVLTLFWTASGVFSQLDLSFNRIWRVYDDKDRATGVASLLVGLLRGRLLSFLLMLAAGVILLMSGVLTTVLAVIKANVPQLPGSAFAWSVIDWTVSPLLSMLALGLLYRYLPNTRVLWSDVWLGALVAGVTNELLKSLVTRFIASGTGGVYQSVAGPLALMIWVYFTSQVVFFGCELTRHYALIYGSRRTLAGKLEAAKVEQEIKAEQHPKHT